MNDQQIAIIEATNIMIGMSPKNILIKTKIAFLKNICYLTVQNCFVFKSVHKI